MSTVRRFAVDGPDAVFAWPCAEPDGAVLNLACHGMTGPGKTAPTPRWPAGYRR